MKKEYAVNLRFLVLAALLAALDIVTVRLLPVYFLPPGTMLFRLSPQYLWFGLAGWILGPGWAMAMAMCSDLVGALINPTGTGVIFPGFTITAGLSGFVYGFIIHQRKVSIIRNAVAVFVHMVLVALPLTSLWNVLQGYYPDFWLPFRLAAPWRLAAVIPFALVLFGLMKALEKPYESLQKQMGHSLS